jgi:hypothetical protein
MADWNARQQRIAVLLASGSTIRNAAAETSTGERTIYHWLDDAGYRAFVASLRGRLLDEALGKLSGTAGAAVDVLRGLLDHPNGHVRLRAALGILDALVKYRDHVELDQRLLDLERRVGDAEDSEAHRVA